MKCLIQATTRTSATAQTRISSGQRPRIDELDLRDRLAADLVDFSIYESFPYRIAERFDRLSRMAWGQALYALNNWRDYDIVYSLGEDAGLALEFLLRLRGIHPRHIMVAHNLLSSRKTPVVRAMRVIDRFERIIVFSSAALPGIVETYGVEPDKVLFTMDAVDDHFWKPDLELEAEPDLILSIGRARRDYPTLLNAVRDLPVRLRIQDGSQWYIAYGGEQFAQDTMPENVEVGDYLSFEELRGHYNRAAFVVIPLEPGAHHSAGTVSIKEAMAMAKAVIVASDGGIEDYVVHGKSGLLVRAGDSDGLRQAIMELCSNPARTEEMGQYGRARLERFMRYDDKIDWLASLAN